MKSSQDGSEGVWEEETRVQEGRFLHSEMSLILLV